MKALAAVVGAVGLLGVNAAFGQTQCGQPITGPGAAYAAAYARDFTLPLIEHNAGGFGPVVWAYVAGQARAESLKHMQDKQGGYVEKKGRNFWNVQADQSDQCKDTTMVGCKEEHLNDPLVANGRVAKLGQCWMENGVRMQWVGMCFVKYPSLQAAADDYLLRRPGLTDALTAMGKGNPSIDQFFEALKASKWSDQYQTAQYETDTKDAIRQALRGLATLRAQQSASLKSVSGEIDAWCGAAGVGDPAERSALAQKQSSLLGTLASIAKACASDPGDAAPQANGAIDTCRTQAPPPPPPVPTAPQQAPAGAASGNGDPHYMLPDGRMLTTQKAGEFWLLSAADGTRVQVRHVPWHDSRTVAAIGAVAIEVDGRPVHVAADGGVRIGGKVLPWASRFDQVSLGASAVLGRWGDGAHPSTVAVMWANGRTLRIRVRRGWLDLETTWSRATSADNETGIVGRGSSDSAGSLISRSGQRGSLAEADARQAFVESWRVTAAESLFHYGEGETYASINLLTFPAAAADWPAKEALARARARCERAGVAAARVDACAFDLAATGGDDFLASHQQAPSPPVATEGGATYALQQAQFSPELDRVVRTLENGRFEAITIASRETKTFRIDANRDKPSVYLHVYTGDLSCLGDSAFDGTRPGLQVFNERREAISAAIAICTDTLSETVEPGTYYLVVRGAEQGDDVNFKVEAFAY